MSKSLKSSKSLIYWLLGGVILLIMGAVLYFMGRVPWCTCGYVKFWHGVTVSSENSQHLFDWYAFTHVIHGMGFYLLLWIIDRKKHLSFAAKLILAIGLEAAWEVLENTDFVINRYRAATISLDYYGDSVLNSIGDVLAMIFGFYLVFRTRLWVSILFAVALELFLLFMIRDNLTINIIMLLHPIPAIRVWQAS